MEQIFWTFEDIANYTGYSYTHVRDRLMKQEGAPAPVMGRNRFLKSEVVHYLTSRQAKRQTG